MSTTMTLSDIPFTAVQTDDDAALLRRYARGREQAAFNRLVDRHGPLVLGVCQRLLGEGAEADQAFQDAFLALARRANALNVPVSGLGPWLYETARRSALKLSSRRARVLSREVTLASISEPVVEEEHPNEVLPVLDESLATLPRREREVLVQCYLQGRTYAEKGNEKLDFFKNAMPLGNSAPSSISAVCWPGRCWCRTVGCRMGNRS